MKLTITTLAGEFFTLEVSEDLEVENFKVFCEMESGVPSYQMLLVWNGVPLADDKKKLNEYGVKDGDMVLVQPARRSQPGQGQGAGTNHPSSDHYIIFQIIIYVFPLFPGRGNQGSSGQPRGGMPPIDFSQIQIPGGSSAAGPSSGAGARPNADDPATLRNILLNSPHDLALLKERNPPLAEALLSGSIGTVCCQRFLVIVVNDCYSCREIYRGFE
jgi:DNA damage-inducible protein 1